MDKKDKEIERLNKENKILRENTEHNDKVVDKVNWENKRLNNIINELEKTLNERKNKTNIEPMTERTKIRINYNLDYVLNRLKELKGENIYD